MGIRLIAIDIDGTLMPSRGPRISQRNCAALRAAEAAGIEVVIATGRRQAYAMPLIAPVGLSEDSVMISSNGAVIRGFDGTLLDRRFLAVDTARQLSQLLSGHGTLVFTFDREGQGGLVIESLRRLSARIERWVESNRAHLLEVQPIERAFDTGEEPIQGMICGTIEEMRAAEKLILSHEVSTHMAMHRTEYAERDLCILDLLPPGCSKGAALDSLAQIRGLDRDQIMAIGDNLNDVEMLKYAGRPVVMANSCADLLSMAAVRGWERTCSNDEEGVALAIEGLLSEAAVPVVEFAR
jgi:Cof subfamily protein (haloacid dehalogenase superfamily)